MYWDHFAVLRLGMRNSFIEPTGPGSLIFPLNYYWNWKLNKFTFFHLSLFFFIHSWRKSTGSFTIIPGNLFSTLPQATMLSYFSPLKRIYILFTPVSNNKFFTCLQGVNFTKTPWGSSSSYLHLSPKDNVTCLSEVVFFFFLVMVLLMTTPHCKYQFMIWSLIVLLPTTTNLSGIKQKQAYYDHNYLDMGFN